MFFLKVIVEGIKHFLRKTWCSCNASLSKYPLLFLKKKNKPSTFLHIGFVVNVEKMSAAHSENMVFKTLPSK